MAAGSPAERAGQGALTGSHAEAEREHTAQDYLDTVDAPADVPAGASGWRRTGRCVRLCDGADFDERGTHHFAGPRVIGA
jgi:hypothetical protein